MESLVTVILPTHNHAPFIAQAIESVLMQQTDFPFDILLHDDASTDGTADVCRAYAKEHPDKITLIAQSVNQYQIDRRIQSHILIPRVKAKYTAILDGDDFWVDPLKLQKQTDYMENHPDCTLCIGSANVVDVNNKVVGRVAPYDEDRVVDPADMIRGGGGFVATNTILMPTELLKNLPEFADHIEAEDIPFQLLGALAGYAWYIAGTLIAYRQLVPGSWSVRQYASSMETRIKTSRDVIALNEGYDAYSGGKYHEAFVQAIQYQEFLILCYTHKLREAMRPPYRRFYDALSAKRKIRLRCEKYFPKLTARYIAWLRQRSR
ncbi:MAG TPA: glycosyltransferase family A protein [Eubacteriales bacterium]|nr:glycosyltransferase family A protein [Eubacteriales bacterium]